MKKIKSNGQKPSLRTAKWLSLCAGAFMFSFIAACGSGSGNSSNDEETTKTDTVTVNEGNAETFQELGIINIKEGHWDKYLSAMQNNIANSRQEPENISFTLYQPEDGKQQALWFERFENKAAYVEHQEYDYLKTVIRVVDESAEGEVTAIALKEVADVPAAVVTPVPAKDQSKRNVIVLFDIKPEKRQGFIEAIAEVTPYARQAPGNLGFNIFQYADDPNKFVLVEGWESVAAHETHLEQDYSKKLDAAIEGAFVSNPMDSRWLARDISQ